MKLKNFKVKKYTLLKLYLLKYQAHKINFQSSTSKTIDYIELCLKQALNLIYLYHSSNKRILFIARKKYPRSLGRSVGEGISMSKNDKIIVHADLSK